MTETEELEQALLAWLGEPDLTNELRLRKAAKAWREWREWRERQPPAPKSQDGAEPRRPNLTLKS
jgi:hypothetical protein